MRPQDYYFELVFPLKDNVRMKNDFGAPCFNATNIPEIIIQIEIYNDLRLYYVYIDLCLQFYQLMHFQKLSFDKCLSIKIYYLLIRKETHRKYCYVV